MNVREMTYSTLRKFLNSIPMDRRATFSHEFTKQFLESIKVLFNNLLLSFWYCPEQLVQLHGQAQLGVLLSQLLELHAGGALVAKQLNRESKVRLIEFMHEY